MPSLPAGPSLREAAFLLGAMLVVYLMVVGSGLFWMEVLL